MSMIILHPTETGQWHALVNEAQAVTNLVLDENAESYLVFLLMRFSRTAKLFESIIGMEFLQAVDAIPGKQFELLKDIGDKSLLLCGLFPDLAKRRAVSPTYFSNIGQTAYDQVSELAKNQTKALFHQLSEEFIKLQHVLQAMQTHYFKFDEINPRIISKLNLAN